MINTIKENYWLYFVNRSIKKCQNFQSQILIHINNCLNWRTFFVASIYETLYFSNWCPIFVDSIYKNEHVDFLPNMYRKVTNRSLSRLVAHFQIFRRLMKGKFDAYVLWTLAIKFQNWIADCSRLYGKRKFQGVSGI